MTDLPVVVTRFETVFPRHKTELTATLAQLRELHLATVMPTKELLPLIKLAAFGMVLSSKKILRHDRNMVAVTGCELDYDGGVVTYEEAHAKLAAARITALIHTTPSHMKPGKGPRWRVLCTFSKPLPPADRTRMLARLNGILGGIAGPESFPLSQSYFIGHPPDVATEAEVLDGDFIDLRDDLDRAAIGKHTKQTKSGNGHANAEYTDLEELRARIVSGESFHPSVTAIVGKMIRNRAPRDFCISYLRTVIHEADNERYEGRWREVVEAVNDIYAKEESKQQAAAETAALTMEMFYYHSQENKFIFAPAAALWQRAAVNARLPPIGRFAAATIIAAERPVEQATWWPGQPRIIQHKLVRQGGMIDHPNAKVFNFYQPPVIVNGNARAAQRFIDHVHLLYPDEALHILKWCACRVQHPEVKINHALVLGGSQGIGKDTLLFPLLDAVGHWNVHTVSPSQALEKFNECLQSVILLITEARDMGEVNRPQFYEHLKQVIAAPPDVLYINPKNLHQYYIPNLTGVVITTNHKAGGIYLSPEDRRHFIAWSTLEQKDFEAGYFERIWHGYLHHTLLDDVAEYLRTLSLADFDPKAPPPKTQAFWEIVSAGQQPECADLESAIKSLGDPDLITLDELISHQSLIDGDFVQTLRKSRRLIARWMEECGYKVVRNPGSTQGLWHIRNKQQLVYGKSSIPNKDLMRAIAHKYR